LLEGKQSFPEGKHGFPHSKTKVFLREVLTKYARACSTQTSREGPYSFSRNIQINVPCSISRNIPFEFPENIMRTAVPLQNPVMSLVIKLARASSKNP
jgi:hypothetical protein